MVERMSSDFGRRQDSKGGTWGWFAIAFVVLLVTFLFTGQKGITVRVNSEPCPLTDLSNGVFAGDCGDKTGSTLSKFIGDHPDLRIIVIDRWGKTLSIVTEKR